MGSLVDLLITAGDCVQRRKIAALGVIGNRGDFLENGKLEKIVMSKQRLGWGLLVGVGLIVFAVLAWQVLAEDSPVKDFDSRCDNAMKEDAKEHPQLRRFFDVVTQAGDRIFLICLAVVGSVVLLLFKQWRLAVLWLVAAALGAGINYTTKTLIDRERPKREQSHATGTERNPSYPSGHSMGSAIGYGMLGYCSVTLLRRRWAKVLVVLFLATLVLTIGVSRFYLRAHWFSDVVGGFALGFGWLTACLMFGTALLNPAVEKPMEA